MTKTKILVVDNDPDFLETRREFLEKEGYHVITASSPYYAQEKFEQERVDLAVVDIRLVNDDDEKDNSGLELAKKASHHLPVIILTGYPSTEYARQSLATQFDGTHIAYYFLAKEEGPKALLSAIERTLEISKRQGSMGSTSRSYPNQESFRELKATKLNVPEQMLKDYELARLHARWIGWVRLGLVIGGVLVFLSGVIAVIMGYRDAGTIGAIAGAITGTIGGLITKLANDANRRWEQFHKELMLLYKNNTHRKKQRGG